MPVFPPDRTEGPALPLRRPESGEIAPVLAIFRDDPAVTGYVEWHNVSTEPRDCLLLVREREDAS